MLWPWKLNSLRMTRPHPQGRWPINLKSDWIGQTTRTYPTVLGSDNRPGTARVGLGVQVFGTTIWAPIEAQDAQKGGPQRDLYIEMSSAGPKDSELQLAPWVAFFSWSNGQHSSGGIMDYQRSLGLSMEALNSVNYTVEKFSSERRFAVLKFKV